MRSVSASACSALVFAALLFGCSRDPHSVVTIADPLGFATSAVQVDVGEGLQTERFDLEGRGFPLTVTIIVEEPGVRTLIAEARDAQGTVVARGRRDVTFGDASTGADVITLSRACVDACDDGDACNGLEACEEGICVVVTPAACNDGNDNPNDGCDACRETTWTSTIVTGFGPADRAEDVTFFGLTEVAYDREGNLYILDSSGFLFRQEASTNAVNVVAGGGPVNQPLAPIPAALASLFVPVGLALDADDNVYFGEFTTIRRFDPETVEVAIIGGLGSTELGVGQTEPASAVSFGIIETIVYDPAGALIVAGDSQRIHRIELPSLDTTLVLDVGEPIDGLAVNGAGEILVGLRDRVIVTDGTTIEPYPHDVGRAAAMVFDAVGTLTVADEAGRRILQVPPNGSPQTILGNGDRGFTPDGPADDVSLNDIPSLTLDPMKNVVFAEVASADRVRRVVDRDGTRVIETLLGPGRLTNDGIGAKSLPGFPFLAQPRQLTTDSNGDLIAAIAAGTGQVWRVRDGLVEVLAGTRQSGASDEDGPATSLFIREIGGVAVDGDDLYFTEPDRGSIRRVRAGAATTIETNLGRPQNIFADGRSLYVLDAARNAVVRTSLDGGEPLTIAGGGTQTATPGATAADVRFDALRSFALHESRVVIAADGAVWVVDNGLLLPIAPIPGFVDPAALAVHGDRLFVQDLIFFYEVDLVSGVPQLFAGPGTDVGDGAPRQTADVTLTETMYASADALWYGQQVFQGVFPFPRIRRIAFANGLVRTVVGSVDPIGDGRLGPGRFVEPTELVGFGDGYLVADGRSGRIRSADPVEGRMRTVVGTPNGRPGDFVPVDVAMLLENAAGIAYDAMTGNVYVTEAGAHVVRVIRTDMDPWTISTFAGVRGEAGTGVVDGPRSTVRFDGPTGLAFEPNDRRLFIADTGNHVVRVASVDDETGPVARFAGVFGRDDSTVDIGDALEAPIASPAGVAIAADGAVFITERGAGKLRVVRDGQIFVVARDLDEPTGVAADPFGNAFVTTAREVLVIGFEGTTPKTQRSIYGGPTAATRCLSGILMETPERALVLDRCLGYLLSLERTYCDVSGCSTE